MMKDKGYKVYKCDNCTAIFKIEAIDSGSRLNYCPNCGKFNFNYNTADLFTLPANDNE